MMNSLLQHFPVEVTGLYFEVSEAGFEALDCSAILRTMRRLSYDGNEGVLVVDCTDEQYRLEGEQAAFFLRYLTWLGMFDKAFRDRTPCEKCNGAFSLTEVCIDCGGLGWTTPYTLMVLDQRRKEADADRHRVEQKERAERILREEAITKQ